MRGNWGIQAGRGPLTYCLVVNRNEEPRHLMRRRRQGEIDASLSITFKDEPPSIASLRYVMGRTWSNHTSESNHSFTLPTCIRRRAGVESAGPSSAVHPPYSRRRESIIRCIDEVVARGMIKWLSGRECGAGMRDSLRVCRR
jgi:hypothetical protein